VSTVRHHAPKIVSDVTRAVKALLLVPGGAALRLCASRSTCCLIRRSRLPPRSSFPNSAVPPFDLGSLRFFRG